MANSYIVIDVETVGSASKIETFDTYNKDKFKFDEYWLNRNPEGSYDDWRRYKMGTSPEYCSVVGLNWLISEEDIPHSIWVGEEIDGVAVTEKMLLQKYINLFKTKVDPLVGYNILAFDLPVLKWRFAIHGLKFPRDYTNLKPWLEEVIDEMAKLYPSGTTRKSMKELRATLIADGAISIPEKYTEILTMNGGEVHELYEKKDFATLKLYGELDVISEAAIYRLFKGLWW